MLFLIFFKKPLMVFWIYANATHTEQQAHLYLRKAADEAVVSTGAVLSVQAVVEEVGVADSHIVQTDVKLYLDAAPQVVAATGELNEVKGQ